MTTSPSDLAERVAGIIGSGHFTSDHGTAKVHVEATAWVAAHESLASEMPFFSWLSAVDWTTEVTVGDPPEIEEIEQRYEILSCVGSIDGGFVVLSADISREQASIASIVDVFGGANWHEREAAEMFGIEFTGHPNLTNLYLPDGFEGHPLRKTFPLLSREVKPWPGTVDVEDMPSTENPEDAR